LIGLDIIEAIREMPPASPFWHSVGRGANGRDSRQGTDGIPA
jgi:hypothetical protein